MWGRTLLRAEERRGLEGEEPGVPVLLLFLLVRLRPMACMFQMRPLSSFTALLKSRAGPCGIPGTFLTAAWDMVGLQGA